MKMETVCPICYQRDETSMHALWRCSSLRSVRSVLCVFRKEKTLDSIPFFDFVVSCKEKVGSLEFELLCVVWRRIWHRRNHMLHSSILLPETGIYEWAVNFIDSFWSANKVENPDSMMASVAKH
ncbi:hypothetical protein Ddye_010551 [Dipteronia dyeriana]|uniref:Reverse transcriptase zinc-binding domain-containing protein n=1 Tax=Dipteronia dyeriana TaxID=168575 RepID=A0AAD9XDI6_9ROSI|nr:hypothetical protein Ddye_010551 [Dipteronia dyeriana]